MSVIIVNWRTAPLTSRAVQSVIDREPRVPCEIIVVDNASGDGSAAFLAERHPDIKIVESPANRGFAAGSNLGAAAASGEFLLFLNSDAYLVEEILPACLRAAEAPEAECIVACRIDNPDRTLQPNAFKFPTLGRQFLDIFHSAADLTARQAARLAAAGRDGERVDWINGTFLLIRRSAYARIGGMDESIFMYAEDIDLCRRARQAGIECVYLPSVRAVHEGGGSVDHASLRGLVLSDSGRLVYWRKWHGPASALALRGIFALRSLLRLFANVVCAPAWPLARRRARVHGLGLLFLIGLSRPGDIPSGAGP